MCFPVSILINNEPVSPPLLQPSAHAGGGGVGGSFAPTDSWNQHRPEQTAMWSPNIEVLNKISAERTHF